MSTDAPQLGKDLKVPLECPTCGERGWVQWEHLGSLIRCNQCDCRFQVGHNGITPKTLAPPLAYHCPRCGDEGEVAPAIAERGVACCVACQLPFRLGPDHLLHSVEEVVEQQRATTKAQVAARRSERTPAIAPAIDLPPHWRWIGGAVGGALILTLGLIFLWPSNTPDRYAVLLTQYCLSEDAQRAKQYLPDDDDLQRVEFKRWQIIHFASIANRLRPSGDRTSISTEVLERSDDEMLLQVTVASSFLGARSHLQHWRRLDSRWTFDPAGSLRRWTSARQSE